MRPALRPAIIAVTGATGFLGSHIAEALMARDYAIRGVVRSPEKGAWLAERGVVMARADLSDRAALARAFEGSEAVVANAAMGSFQGDLDAMLAVNHQGAENVANAAADAGVTRLVLISTVAVYRTRVRHRMGEDAERYGDKRRLFNVSDATTDWRYALSKSRGEAATEAIAKDRGLELTILRPGPIYGPRDPKFSARLNRAMARSVAPAPTVGVPLVHARDVADAAAGALANAESVGRAYNLAGPPVSFRELMQTLKVLRGGGPVLVPVPLPFWVAYDTSAAERDLGFSSRPLEEGLREL